MAKRRLNKKVALIGSTILVLVVVGAIWVILGLSKNPQKFLAEAEAAVLEKDYERAISRYAEAFGRAKTNTLREEILLKLVDVSMKADQWDLLVRYWSNVITINPRSAKARFGRLKYLYIVAESGSSRVWQQVQKDATEFLEMAEEEGLLSENVSQWDVLVAEGQESESQSLNVYLYLVRARATLELAMLGAVANKDEALSQVAADLEQVKTLDPKNIESYRYLAGAAVEKGKLDAARGLFSERDTAAMEAKTLLEEAVKVSSENPLSHINLLKLKLVFSQGEPQAKEEIKALEPEYASLVRDFPASADAYVALSEYYSVLAMYSRSADGLASLDKAIGAAEKAVELKPGNVDHIINAMQLNDRKFSVYEVSANLHRATELSRKGLGVLGVKDKPGPWVFVNKMNRYRLYSCLAKISIHEILEPSESLTESQSKEWLANAEESVHEIEQVFKSGQEPQLIKWRGMLELAKGQRNSAVKKLYAAYEQMKALKPSKPPWQRDPDFADLCYLLARVFENTSELGAVAEFLTSSLHSGISSIMPEVRMDYVDAILKFGMWSDAIEHIDVYERWLAPSERSTLLRIRTYIGAGEYDKATKELSARPENDPNTMKLSLSLVDAQIKQTQLGLARLENKEFLDVAFEGLATDLKETDPAGNIAAIRKELNGYKDLQVQLVNKLLPVDPDSIESKTIVEVCRHLVARGSADQAKKLVGEFLGRFPEDRKALIYREMLSEPDPGSISKERLVEIEEAVLSKISDPATRDLELGIFWRRQGESDKAIAALTKALDAQQPKASVFKWYFESGEEEAPRFLSVGHLFDIAVEKKDWNLAEKAATIAREEDLDGCEGNVFAARLEFARGQFQEAKTRIDESLKMRPVFSRAYSLRSNIHAALGDEHAAIEDVRRATSMNPLDGLIAKSYAQLLVLRNQKLGDSVTSEQTDEARKAIQRAMALNPGDRALRKFFADFISSSDPLKALAILQAFHKSEPTFENCLKVGELATRIARDETNEQRKAVLFAVAGSALNDARKMKPQDEIMLYHYTEYLRAMGRDSEVVTILSDANERNLLWDHYYQRGQYEEAKRILEQLYEAEPGNTQVIKGLVRIAEKTSDANAAIKYSDELIAADPTVDNYLIQVQSFLRVGLISEAAMKLQSFTEKHPDEPRTLLLRAWLEMRKGQLEKAMELTNQYLEDNPENPTGWRLRGEIHFYEADIAKAVEDLKKSKSLKDEPATRVILAKAYLRVGRFEDAVTELKNAIDSPEVPMEARLLLEDTFRQLDRKESLDEFYNGTINKFPTSVFWLNRAGAFAIETGAYDRASQLYARAFHLKRQEYGDKNVEELRFDALYASAFDGYMRAFILLAGLPNTSNWNPKRLDEVSELAKEYLETDYSPLAYLRMAQAKLLLGHKKTAVEYCQKAVDEAEGNDMLASEVLLRMFLLLGSEDVEKYCIEKLKTDPDSIPANFTLFNLYKVNREYFKALPYIEKCIQLSEADSRRILDYTAKKAEILTLAYQRSSDNKYLRMAVADYKSLLAKMPNNTSVLNNLAYMLADSNEDLAEALKYAEKVYSQAPNDPGVLDTYGYVLFKNGKYGEALGHLNAALQQYAQKKLYVGPEVYEHLGMIKEALADKAGAISAYKLALEVGAGSLTEKDINRIKTAIENLSK